ncbi:MAG: hypothetical protein AAGD33_18540 [Actinomycetota bacterium]
MTDLALTSPPSRSSAPPLGPRTTSSAVAAIVAVLLAVLLAGADTLRRLAVRVAVAVRRDERGQATTEYALVLLAAALVALLVIAWATAGGGAARIARLFDSVIDAVIDRV